MTLYSNVVFVHIVSALALFLGYGLEWTVGALLRHSSTTDQARAWLRVYRVSPPVTGAALAVLLLSGGWLAALTGGMYHAWLIVSVAGIVVALLIGFALILPRVSAIREALPEGNLPLSPEALLQLQSAELPTLIRVRAAGGGHRVSDDYQAAAGRFTDGPRGFDGPGRFVFGDVVVARVQQQRGCLAAVFQGERPASALRKLRAKRTGPTQANALRQIEEEHFGVLHTG